MTDLAAKLLQDALKLSEVDREMLAQSLWESLDHGFAHEADPEWQAMIARRIAEVESGKAKLIPWEQVRKEVFGDLDERAAG